MIFAFLTVCLMQTAQTMAAGHDWQDFSGGCLQPASLQKGETLVFTSPAKVLAAIERFEEDRLGGSCGPEFGDAFAQLKRVLDKDRVLGDICGDEAYERIRSYHLAFIRFYAPEMTRDQLVRLNRPQSGGSWFWSKSQSQSSAEELAHELKPIPEALRQFFVNFVKQANAQCKQRLVSRIDAIEHDESLVNSEDFAVIGKYKGESDRLRFLYELTKAGRSSYGRDTKSELNELEIVDQARAASLPINKLPATGGAAQAEEDGLKLYLQVPFDDKLRRIKEACLKRFMPVYSELFAPVIRLNNLGYIDRANSKQQDLALETRAATWLSIIQTCEVLKDIEIVHDASAQSAMMDMVLASSHLAERARRAQARQAAPSLLGHEIRLLSRAQARQLMDSNEVRPLYEPRRAQLSHERTVFTERMWLTKPDEVRRQTSEFEADVRRLISAKTSFLKSFRDDVAFQLRTAFKVGRRQVLDKDETAMLGRLVVFVERHQNLIRGFGIVMSIIMMSAAVG